MSSLTMKHSAAVAVGSRCQVTTFKKATRLPHQVTRYRATDVIDTATDHGGLSAAINSHLQHQQAQRARHAEGFATEGSRASAPSPAAAAAQQVPEHVASARAWIAAWKAKQTTAQTPGAPENVASARAWKSQAQVSEGPEVDVLDALRCEVEKLRALLPVAEAAAAEAERKLHSAKADRNVTASGLAREATEAAALRQQQEAVLAAFTNVQDKVQELLLQQQEAEARAAAVRQQQQQALSAAGGAADTKAATAASKQLPKRVQAENKPHHASAGGFTNTNRYWVPQNLELKFLRAVAQRQLAMQKAKGFLALAVHEFADQTHPEQAYVMEVSSSWATVPDWEAWSGGREVQRHQLPAGVMQFPPKRGEGFPEDFMPFKDLAAEPPNAKY